MNKLFALLIAFNSLLSLAQSESEANEEHHFKHRISLGLGHTHVPQGELVDGRNRLAFASWSLDYDYHFNSTWAIGLQTDIITESYTIIRRNEEVLEREFPFSLTPVALFKPFEHWSFIGGTGVEFAPGENLWFTRIGVEYSVEVSEKWEFGGTFYWDARWDYYDSWALAIIISRTW